MNSFRIFHRRKNYERKGKQNENGLTPPSNTSTLTNNCVSHSISEGNTILILIYTYLSSNKIF